MTAPKVRKPRTEAYDEGFAAYNAGVSSGANPWPCLDPQNHQWAIGWLNANHAHVALLTLTGKGLGKKS